MFILRYSISQRQPLQHQRCTARGRVVTANSEKRSLVQRVKDYSAAAIIRSESELLALIDANGCSAKVTHGERLTLPVVLISATKNERRR
jgi:hypothetical protein